MLFIFLILDKEKDLGEKKKEAPFLCKVFNTIFLFIFWLIFYCTAKAKFWFIAKMRFAATYPLLELDIIIYILYLNSISNTLCCMIILNILLIIYGFWIFCKHFATTNLSIRLKLDCPICIQSYTQIIHCHIYNHI